MATLNVNRAEFIRSAASPKQFIRTSMPTVVFAGKSNVGKSSVINRMLNRKNFARVGASPGKTVHVNYFFIDEKLYFVDLPGYGYAKVTKELVAKWGKMIERYLITSRQLRCIFLLVDIRHEPSENDKAMYAWIVDRGLRPVVIATKADKIKRSQLAAQTKLIRTALSMAPEDTLIVTSSSAKTGLADVWKVMEERLAPATV